MIKILRLEEEKIEYSTIKEFKKSFQTTKKNR